MLVACARGACCLEPYQQQCQQPPGTADIDPQWCRPSSPVCLFGLQCCARCRANHTSNCTAAAPGRRWIRITHRPLQVAVLCPLQHLPHQDADRYSLNTQAGPAHLCAPAGRCAAPGMHRPYQQPQQQSQRCPSSPSVPLQVIALHLYVTTSIPAQTSQPQGKPD